MSKNTLPRFANLHGAVVTIQPSGKILRVACDCGFWEMEHTDGAARRTAQSHAEKCLALPK